MTIFVNGESRELADRQTIQELLTLLGYEHAFVAVALNNVCVSRSEFCSTRIQAGDQLEILAPMAGG